VVATRPSLPVSLDLDFNATMNCDTEYNLYWMGVILSLVMTFGVSIYRRKMRNFVEDPDHGRAFYMVMAVIKVLLGLLLLTLLYPSDCAGFESFYGFVAIAIGIYWMVLAVTQSDVSSSNASEMPPMQSNAVSKEIV